ncbi:MAG: DUF4129 domain-containing protein [Acidobacteriota bacterium]|jgi:hypothetical protein|nr:DUF4129 domain-containing protein [Acidobacteriota bacterium]
MPRRLIPRLALALSLLGFAASLVFPGDARRELSLPEYAAELERVSALAADGSAGARECAALARALPGEWTVRAGGRRYTVGCAWLKSALPGVPGSPEARRDVRRHIAALQEDARALAAPSQDFAPARRELSRILARREFRAVRGPSAWDRFRQKVLMFVVRLLEKAFGGSHFADLNKAFVWCLVAVAVAALASWICRIMKRSSPLDAPPQGEDGPVSALPWREWLRRAHEAAAAGGWREAVRLAYWGGISFLEAGGAWPPDKARTPREYLRLMPAGGGEGKPLAELTREFESVWYGRAQAGPESFAESLRHLEVMGCRCD